MALNKKSTQVFQLEQRSAIKFLVAEKCKTCEIFRSMCDVYKEAHFSQKMFTNGLTLDLPRQALVEKTVDGVETHWLSGLKKGKIPDVKVQLQTMLMTNSLAKISRFLLNDHHINFFFFFFFFFSPQ